jgi:Ca2+-transporting ATPase
MLNGSATEAALMQLAIVAGVAIKSLRGQYQRLNVEYRAEGRNYMSILFRAQEGKLLAVKGNPEEVLLRCRWVFKDGLRSELTPEMRVAILNENEKMAGQALRVLGFAYASLSDTESTSDPELTWLGLAGMADPIRPGVDHLIDTLQHAGIKTVMITGDQSATAYAVSKQLRLSGTPHLEMLDSAHLERLDPQLLAALAQKIDIFSRVSPSHKLRIVQAMQQAGQVVAMTGDGINDGPALKAADIGIAMGSNGTEAARSVADVVLENDDLKTLIIAVSQGRTIYNNIRKSVHFLTSTNLSEILLVLGAVGSGLGQPLNAMQLLWINLLTDVFPALALSVEPPEPDVLLTPPRDPDKSIISNADLKRYGFESLTISAATMATYGYGIARYGFGPQASTMAFMNLTLAQLLHAYSCRSEQRSIFKDVGLRGSPYLHLAVGGSLALQLLTIFSPVLRRLLGTAPLHWTDLLSIAGGSVLPFVVNEATKSATEAA